MTTTNFDGGQLHEVKLHDLTIWFSGAYPVAFHPDHFVYPVVCQHVPGVSKESHLALIDGADHGAQQNRVPVQEFRKNLSEILGRPVNELTTIQSVC